jgi:sugar/nucleoside kinase (ribokinase family)
MSAPPTGRLVHLGNVIVDIVMAVPALPVAGSDVRAADTRITAGAGFNVMVAARRQGMTVVHGGVQGAGSLGDLLRAQMEEIGIQLVQPPSAAADSGFCVALVDASGERTFVTSVGAEATLEAAGLDRIAIRPEDTVYLSGYSLLSPVTGPALAQWIARLADPVTVVVDPQPLVADIPAEVLGPVLDRVDWWTCNSVEAARSTGCTDPSAAARRLLELTRRASVLVRLGPVGCLVAPREETARLVAAPRVEAVDTNGAGDTHTGVFVAAVAAGAGPIEAAVRANAAAALAVTRFGPATAPSAEELERFLASSGAA